jgi:hypothetical protein
MRGLNLEGRRGMSEQQMLAGVEEYSKKVARGVQMMREAQFNDPLEVCLRGGLASVSSGA